MKLTFMGMVLDYFHTTEAAELDCGKTQLEPVTSQPCSPSGTVVPKKFPQLLTRIVIACVVLGFPGNTG